MGERWPEEDTSVDLTVDAPKGATSVQVTSSAGFSVGQLVLLDEITDDSFVTWGSNPAVAPGGEGRGWFTRYDRPVGQMLEIAAIDGSRVSFTTALHIAFDTTHAAQLTRYTHPGVRNAGLEDLYISGGRNGNISMSLAMYSWVRNVDSDQSFGDSIGLIASFRCVVRDSYFHDTTHPYPGGAGYLLSIGEYTADSLIENSIFVNANKVMVMRASGGGNVIGYNYFDNGYIEYNHDWVETGINASHMTCPHFELFEGNQAFNADGDNTWGGAVYNTFFRNHLTGKRRSFADIQNRRGIGLMYGHYYYSFVGNVLGYDEMSPAPYGGFTYEDGWPWEGDPVPMWRLGYNPEDWDAPAEARVVNTAFRHGNFDFATHAIHWDAVTSNRTLPPSMYLTSKPPFFGSSQWPWVDPLTGMLYALPARARFDGGSPSSCAITLNPTGTPGSLPSSGGGGSFSVTMGLQSCRWTATPGAPWITMTSPSGPVTGNGSVSYRVAANSGVSRATNITVASGATQAQFSIAQDGAEGLCSISVSPLAAYVSAGAGSGSFDVSLASDCVDQNYSSLSDSDWLHVGSGGSGMGSGSIGYSYDANPSSSGRTGAITISNAGGGSSSFNLTQSGQGQTCTYSVGAFQQTYPDTGGAADISVTAGAGCAWSAASGADWIHFAPKGGDASGSTAMTVDPNLSTTDRGGSVNVAGTSFTIAQAAHAVGTGPTITNITSKTGKAGSAATIYGTGFLKRAKQNVVSFGTKQARVAKATATMLKVKIPKRVKGTVGVYVTVSGQKSNTVLFTVK